MLLISASRVSHGQETTSVKSQTFLYDQVKFVREPAWTQSEFYQANFSVCISIGTTDWRSAFISAWYAARKPDIYARLGTYDVVGGMIGQVDY